MGGLLTLNEQDKITLHDIDKIAHHHFVCIGSDSYENHYNHIATRYHLKSLYNHHAYFLDVQKSYENDVIITCYKEIEKMAFNINFFSLVGTSPLGYKHPDLDHLEYILYKHENKALLDYVTIKYYLSKSELPQDPQQHGYYQDGEGNWYFLTDKYEGEVLKFENEYRTVWEYYQEKNEKLMIEIELLPNMMAYLREKPIITIYEGQRIGRKEIARHPHSQQEISSIHTEIYDKV